MSKKRKQCESKASLEGSDFLTTSCRFLPSPQAANRQYLALNPRKRGKRDENLAEAVRIGAVNRFCLPQALDFICQFDKMQKAAVKEEAFQAWLAAAASAAATAADAAAAAATAAADAATAAAFDAATQAGAVDAATQAGAVDVATQAGAVDVATQAGAVDQDVLDLLVDEKWMC